MEVVNSMVRTEPQSEVEVWKIVEDFPDYAVSDKGRVQRLTPNSRGDRRMKILKNVITAKGYHQVGLYRDGKCVSIFVHKLVCRAFHGEPLDGQTHTAHGDGIPTNNIKENLRWATPTENNGDKIEHGTVPFGQKSHLAKLSDEKVRAIRNDERSQRKIAKDYGITQANVSHIKLRKSWSHVE